MATEQILEQKLTTETNVNRRKSRRKSRLNFPIIVKFELVITRNGSYRTLLFLTPGHLHARLPLDRGYLRVFLYFYEHDQMEIRFVYQCYKNIRSIVFFLTGIFRIINFSRALFPPNKFHD